MGIILEYFKDRKITSLYLFLRCGKSPFMGL